jgi:hypothetical protein
MNPIEQNLESRATPPITIGGAHDTFDLEFELRLEKPRVDYS